MLLQYICYSKIFPTNVHYFNICDIFLRLFQRFLVCLILIKLHDLLPSSFLIFCQMSVGGVEVLMLETNFCHVFLTFNCNLSKFSTEAFEFKEIFCGFMFSVFVESTLTKLHALFAFIIQPWYGILMFYLFYFAYMFFRCLEDEDFDHLIRSMSSWGVY